MTTRNSHSQKRGFTLIEVLVALAIFSVALIIIVAAYSRFVRSQQRSIDNQEVQEDVRLTLEVFSREARTGFGSTYQLLPGSDSHGVTFRNQQGVCVLYLMQDSVLYRNQATNAAQDEDCAGIGLYNPAEDQAVSDASGAVTIDEFSFTVTTARVGGDGSLFDQGYITLSMVVQPRDLANPSPISLQTTVTSRQVLSYQSL